MDVIIVCHTEFGRIKDKKVIAVKDPNGFVDSIKNLLNVTDKYGAKVTFAICPEVAQYFPIKLECEIGLHIHPGWQEFKVDGTRFYVGDKFLRLNCNQSSTSTVLRDYSYSDQVYMIEIGKNYLIKIFGIIPKVFVAGRWSINNDTVKALIGTGFTHDCSAIAHTKANHYDWSKLPKRCMPYNPNSNDYQEKGDLPLLIVPISQMIKGGNANPEMARVYGVNWLKLAFKDYFIRKMSLFHICLHSPCMIDPFYVEVMDKLLKYIAGHEGIQFKYASEISEYLC